MNTTFLTFVIIVLIVALVTVVVIDIIERQLDEEFRDRTLDVMRRLARRDADLSREFSKFLKMVPKLPPPPAPKPEQDRAEKVPSLEFRYFCVIRGMIPLLFDKRYIEGMPDELRQRLIITLRAAFDAHTGRELDKVVYAWRKLDADIEKWASQTLMPKP